MSLNKEIRSYELFFGGSPESLPNKFDISCQAILWGVFLALFFVYQFGTVWLALLIFGIMAVFSPMISKLHVRNHIKWFLDIKKKLEDSDEPDKLELLRQVDSVLSEHRAYVRAVQASE